jgi:hypothetical protein
MNTVPRKNEQPPPLQTRGLKARFNVDPGAGGLALFAEPLDVLMNNGRRFELERKGGAGEFRRGGANVVDAAGGASLTFGAGRAALLQDFNLSGRPAALEVALGAGADVVPDLAGRAPGAAFFTDPASIVNSGGVISVADPGGRKIGDFSGEFVFASGAGLPPASAFTLNPAIEGCEGTGLAASASMTTVSGDLLVKVARPGTAAFSRAGVNAGLAREAITAVFNSQGPERRRATLAPVMGGLGAFTGEPLAGTAAALLDATWTVINEAGGRFIGSLGRGQLGPGAPSAGDGGRTARAWGGFWYRRLDQDAGGGCRGLSSDTYGGVAGVSGSFAEGPDLGFRISAGRNSTDYEGLSASPEVDFPRFGLVSAPRPIPRLTIAADVSYSIFDVHSERALGAFGTASARCDSKALSLGLEASCAVALSARTALSPFLELRCRSLGQDGFTEEGGGVFGPEFGRISHDGFLAPSRGRDRLRYGDGRRGGPHPQGQAGLEAPLRELFRGLRGPVRRKSRGVTGAGAAGRPRPGRGGGGISVPALGPGGPGFPRSRLRLRLGAIEPGAQRLPDSGLPLVAGRRRRKAAVRRPAHGAFQLRGRNWKRRLMGRARAGALKRGANAARGISRYFGGSIMARFGVSGT